MAKLTSGGQVENPAYKKVCNDYSGHAEWLQIKYETATISFEDLLVAFWEPPSPTTLTGKATIAAHNKVAYFLLQ
jgi:peptide methionine sulfoxide reductase MsrA